MKLSQQSPIANLDELKIHLQYAIGLELTTIPLYLTAWYSIPEGENTSASQVIRSVVMEEMLHMALAANVLNGIGGVPSTALIQGCESGDPIPKFPAKVMFLDGLPTLHLYRFSPDALDTFLIIEHPDDNGPAPKDHSYSSIGAFYYAIKKGIETHCDDKTFADARRARAGCQIEPEQYYGGAGKLITVFDQETALDAIDKIVTEGEGSPAVTLSQTAEAHAQRHDGDIDFEGISAAEEVSVKDGDVLADGWRMYSHYARFKELRVGRRYRPDQRIGEDPAGSAIPVNWDDVYPMAPDPSISKYADAGTEVVCAVTNCSKTYTRLIDILYRSFNGDSGQVRDAAIVMYELKNQALALMKTPSPLPSEKGMTIGPSFDYLR